MITLKALMSTDSISSPDGIHWEPAIPVRHTPLAERMQDAVAVISGKAVAVRQTTASDLAKEKGE
jgi:hypothetical protein